VIFCWKRPDNEKRQHCLKKAEQQDFSYDEVGQSRTELGSEITDKYNIDGYRCLLGHGEAVYLRAMDGLKNWAHFDLGWVHIAAPRPIVGLTVAVAIRVCWIWTLHFTRVTYVRKETLEGKRRWGFAYGTLQWHAEQGEESFLLEYDTETEEVHYQITAFSRPRHFLCWLGYPITRLLQRRFGAQSMKSLQHWVGEDQMGTEDS
jgi:uncharacterized protein (UPF0548 family)